MVSGSKRIAGTGVSASGVFLACTVGLIRSGRNITVFLADAGMNPTGSNAGAQVLEIGLVHARGERIFEICLKLTASIDPAAAAVHNISDDDLVNALSWPDIAQPQHHIGRRLLVIFNADFDTWTLKQTAAAHNAPCQLAGLSDGIHVPCAMRLAAGYYGPTNRYGIISLSGAVSRY